MSQTLDVYPLAVDVGMSNAVCLPPEHLALSDDEAKLFIKDLNHFMPELKFEMVSSSHWKVQLPEALNLKLLPLKKVIGEPLTQCLPTGPDASKLNAWLTEIQMFLRAHPENQKRAENGHMTVDTLCFVGKKRWGFMRIFIGI